MMSSRSSRKRSVSAEMGVWLDDQMQPLPTRAWVALDELTVQVVAHAA